MIHDPSTLIEEYLPEASSGTFSIQDHALLLNLPDTGGQLRLGQAQLSQLARHCRASVDGLTYFDHCGLHTGRYAEFLIYLDSWPDWPTKNALRFRVGEVLVSVGLCSHLVPVLFEPYYRDKRFNQVDFDGYSSIRLVGVTSERAAHVVHEALYYLNSDYLAPIKTGAQIHHLLTQDDLGKLLPWEKADAVSRTRVRRRDPIANLPAILLFNQASVTYGEASFLGYYRVLEYFSPIGFETEVQRLRTDESVPVGELIRISKERSEEDQLRHLLGAVTTPTQRRRLVEYAAVHKLVRRQEFGGLVKALYAFRCSVVHAKVTEMARTLVPNPLSAENALTHWIYVVRELGRIAVRKLGSTELPSNQRLNPTAARARGAAAG